MKYLLDYSHVKKGHTLTVVSEDHVWEAQVERVYSSIIVCTLINHVGRLMVFSSETGRSIDLDSSPSILLNMQFKRGDELAIKLLGNMLLNKKEA